MNKRKFLKTLGAALGLPIFITKAEEKKKILPNVAVGYKPLEHNNNPNTAVGVSAITQITTGSANPTCGSLALKC